MDLTNSRYGKKGRVAPKKERKAAGGKRREGYLSYVQKTKAKGGLNRKKGGGASKDLKKKGGKKRGENFRNPRPTDRCRSIIKK